MNKTYNYYKGLKVIERNNHKYIIKKTNLTRKKDIYSYLENRGFSYYLEPVEETPEGKIYDFIEEDEMPLFQKASDLSYILSLLHNKTTSYKDVVIDSVKAMYEDILNRLNYIEKYYSDLNDILDKKIFYAPDEYHLLRNITLIYESINFSRLACNKWYEIKKNNTTERIVMLHNKVKLDHFLDGERKVLINFDESSEGSPVFDFLSFYKSDSNKVDMSHIYEIYQSKFKYYNDEELLLLSLITIPDKITLEKDHFTNCIIVTNFINYLEKTGKFVSKHYQKYHESNQDKLHKQDNSIKSGSNKY